MSAGLSAAPCTIFVQVVMMERFTHEKISLIKTCNIVYKQNTDMEINVHP